MIVSLLVACVPAPTPTDPLDGLTLVAEDPSDGPIRGLADAWMARFDEGDVEFEAARREADGLGPAYIRSACASCHGDDARGPGVVRKMVVPDDTTLDGELLPFGHTERPYVAGGATTPLTIPDDGRVLVSTRAPPAVFGRGYMEAVADATIEALAAEQAALGVVSGRPNHVRCDFEANDEPAFFPCTPGATVVGRFGLKARVPTLDGFAADAYQGDMAITSPMRPVELPNPDGLDDDLAPGVDLGLEVVNRTADYMRLLAIPARETLDASALFVDVGCADCHVPSLPTRADWPVPELAGVDAELYTDLLLHDMGPAFSDGLSDYEAGPREWRTPPLVGLRFMRSFLHDGRAATVEEATVLHGAEGSEAAPSVAAFQALSDADRAELIVWIESL